MNVEFTYKGTSYLADVREYRYAGRPELQVESLQRYDARGLYLIPGQVACTSELEAAAIDAAADAR